MNICNCFIMFMLPGGMNKSRKHMFVDDVNNRLFKQNGPKIKK